MNAEAPQNREWLQQGAQALAVHTGKSSSKRQWVEHVTINTVDRHKVATDDYAEYAIDTLRSYPEEHFASRAVLVAPDDTEARTMLFLQEQKKAQEAISNAELAVSRKPGSAVARRRLAAAIAASDVIQLAFGDFMTVAAKSARAVVDETHPAV
jgi:hypothetical protein